MTYKQIEASREARLWIGQVIIPAIMVVGAAMTVPEVRKAVTEKANNVKTAIKKKFKKGEAQPSSFRFAEVYINEISS